MLGILLIIIQLLTYAIIAKALLSWVLAVPSFRNSFLFSIDRALGTITSPIMKPIQRYLPRTGTVDFSPMIAIILLLVFQRVLFVIFT